MYFVGQQAAQSDNKYTFTNTILGFTVGKLFLAIMVILGYDQLAEPSSKFFIIPFFVVYAVFTGFETYVMMKLSKAAKT
jgi:formate/nitrite transporter FocA (FNT family)